MRRRWLWLPVCVWGWVVAGCGTDKPAEPPPSYVESVNMHELVSELPGSSSANFEVAGSVVSETAAYRLTESNFSWSLPMSVAVEKDYVGEIARKLDERIAATGMQIVGRRDEATGIARQLADPENGRYGYVFVAAMRQANGEFRVVGSLTESMALR
ncbi:hypothetical protein FJZ36_08040 [Candidatus Poribacteria bacterium]|nr:hypothetical protein [Candidatus Poribacteria bacterium]